jgi:hypothetical protein
MSLVGSGGLTRHFPLYLDDRFAPFNILPKWHIAVRGMWPRARLIVDAGGADAEGAMTTLPNTRC